MKIAVRGWGDGNLLFEEVVDTAEEHLEQLAQTQINRVIEYEHNLLEIEFIEDAPDPNRFFRFGTDASRMVMPIQVKP